MPDTGRSIVDEDLATITAAPLPFDELRGRTVLVTGAAGILATYIVEALLRLNETRRLDVRVLGLVRNRAKADARFSRYRDRRDLQFVVQDVVAPIVLDGPVDVVMHAASPASPRHFGGDPVGTILPNVAGTRRLLELAGEKRSAKFLFFSSAEIYGIPRRHPIRETDSGDLDPMDARSCYAESKRLGETMCAAWFRQHGVPAVVVRPFHTYGPGMPLDDGRVFADFVRDVVERRNIAVRSDGTAVRAYCYLADAVEGFFTVLLRGTPGEAYNVGNDEAEISVVELARTLARLFPERRLEVDHPVGRPVAGYLASPVPRSCPDVSKLRALGWQPRHSIDSGFRRTILSYES